MENITKQYTEQFRRNHRRQHRYACLLGVLALLVCLAVFWRLKLVGTAMTNEASCGLQEHTHTDDCYTDVLVCGFATPETAAGEHEHTADCYVRELTCTLPEHTHTADCYSDAEADTETDADWTASFPQEALTGDWAQDTVLIAASQMNYAESTRNWQLDADGVCHGYTRYGAWYGSPYGDWNSMFAAFCLHYAGVEDAYLTTANAAGVNAWVVNLNQAGQLVGPGHAAVPGDVVFLGSDGKIESCGIVADVADENGVPTLTVIAGDVDNTVAELTVPADSESVLGYAATADAYTLYKEDHPEQETAADEDTPEEADAAETTPETADTLEATDEENAVVTYAAPIDMSGTYTDPDNSENQLPYLTSVKGESTYYDKDDGLFHTMLKMEFEVLLKELRNAGGRMTYTLSDDLIVPDDVLGKTYTGKSGDTEAFDFTIEKDAASGKYVLNVQFRQDFLDTCTDKTINGGLFYTVEVGKDKQNDNGDLVVTIHEKLDLTIKADQITYPTDDNGRSDIRVDKSGSYLTEDGDLEYTVVVSSVKGTPDKIQIADALTLDGLDISSVTLKSVTKWENGNTTSVDATLNAGTDNKSFTMTLGGLAAANDGEQPSKYTIVYRYKLANPPQNYELKKKATNKLTASSTGTGTNNSVKDTDTAEVEVTRELLEKKGEYDASKERIKWTITLNENSDYDNTQSSLTDSMFAEEGKDFSGKLPYNAKEFTVKVYDKATNKEVKDLEASNSYNIETITDADGNVYVKDITFNKVNGGPNNYKYVITYYTSVTPGYTNATVVNTAYFDGQGANGDATVKPPKNMITKTKDASTLMDENNCAVVTWSFTVTAPAGGIPEGTLIKDVMTTSNSGKADHYLTKTQAEALYEKLQTISSIVDLSSVEFLRVDDKGNTQETYTIGTLTDTAKPNAVQFTLATEMKAGDILRLQKYDTTAELLPGADIGSNQNFTNTIYVGSASAAAKETYYKHGVNKNMLDNENRVVTSRDQEFTWYVEVYYNKDDPMNPTTFTVVDTLPRGVELSKVLAGITKQKKDDAQTNNQCWSYDSASNSFTKVWDGKAVNSNLLDLDMKNATVTKNSDGTTTVSIKVDATRYMHGTDYKVFYVNFACKVTSEVWNEKGPGEKVDNKFTNNVTVLGTKDIPYGKTSALNTITVDRTGEVAKPVGKNGTYNSKDQTLDYRVELNPYGKTYRTDGKQLELTDKLDYDRSNSDFVASLRAGSVQLYHATMNENGTLTEDTEPLSASDWQWSVEDTTDGYTINAKVPDGTPLVLKYRYNIEYTGTEKDPKLEADNTAILSSESKKPGSSGISDTWVKTTGGGFVNKAYTLVKVDSRSSSVLLEGATFRVEVYDGNDGYKDTGRRYTTKADGTISIRQNEKDEQGNAYKYNTAYRIVEESPPPSYEMPSNAPYYYFYFSENSDDLPDGLTTENKAIDLSKESRTEYVANSKESIDVSVTKTWTKADGTSLDESDRKPVTVRLYAYTVENALWKKYQQGTLNAAEQQQLDAARESAVQTDSATLDKSNNWSKAFRYLSVKADNNNKYIYFVTEDSMPDFDSTVTQSLPKKDADGVWQVSVGVKNSQKPTYTLPQTGGSGTMPYLAGGAALMAVSLLCGYHKKRKEEEGRQNG